MKGIKAIIFDLDNTLVNRKLAFKNYCASFINEHFHYNELPDTIENMIQDMILLDNNGYRDGFTFYNALVEKWNIKDYTAHQLTNSHPEKFFRFTEPDIDMHIVLGYLAPKYKLGIITNGSAKTQNAKIDYIGIRNLFDSIIISGEIGIAKPDKQIFILSCNSLNVSANEAIYIGDHYENDIIGAKNAGLHTVWYTNDLNNFQPFDNKITRLSDIIDLL